MEHRQRQANDLVTKNNWINCLDVFIYFHIYKNVFKLTVYKSTIKAICIIVLNVEGKLFYMFHHIKNFAVFDQSKFN